ncbi:formimidoylglutamase [Terasakiispira papahanaumokuakeensis]|nr:formimidoylglutamase [Terasakiispira papahanaumokuakeensis]
MVSNTTPLTSLDMSPWTGRIDPEANSERWHQKIQPLTEAAPSGCALLGFESDAGVARNKGRTGAVQGPAAMRQALAPLAWHRHAPAYDAGNIRCEDDALESAQQQLADRVAELLEAGHLPIVMGGGHEVAFGSWSGLAQYLHPQGEPAPHIGIINFDAHFDLRDPSHVHSSGTPFAQIAHECAQRHWPFKYACLGVSRAANTQALFNRAAQLDVLVREDRDFQPEQMSDIRRDLKSFIDACDHLYLTLDLDVLPAAEAPGVSAPAARGVSLSLIEPLIDLIRDSGKLRLADIAELNPQHDIDNRTARAAARVIFQLALER